MGGPSGVRARTRAHVETRRTASRERGLVSSLAVIVSAIVLAWLPSLGACGATADSKTADASSPAEEASIPVAPPVDPALFDCTSLTRDKLPRRAASSVGCLRDPSCKDRLVSGHRGAGGQLGRIAPEDSLAAYRAAVAVGLDLVETDPRPSKDGVIVNVHDDTVDRTTNGTGKVDELTFAELRALTLRTGGLVGDFSCEKIPTLKELLETSVGRALVLVDANKTDRVDLLVGAIREANALEWAVFDTSSTDKIDRALALEPKLMIMPRVGTADEASAVLAKYKDHLPLFVEIDAASFPTGVAEVHRGGSRVFTDVFTTDLAVKLGADPRAYLETYDRGADVAQTDLPDLVLRALGRNVPP